MADLQRLVIVPKLRCQVTAIAFHFGRMATEMTRKNLRANPKQQHADNKGWLLCLTSSRAMSCANSKQAFWKATRLVSIVACHLSDYQGHDARDPSTRGVGTVEMNSALCFLYRSHQSVRLLRHTFMRLDDGGCSG